MRRAVVVHGREDHESRALFIVSALYHCVDVLEGRPVRFVNVDDVAVKMAAQVFAFDTGLETEIVPDTESHLETAFKDAALFVAVALRHCQSIPVNLAQIHQVPSLLVAQFPSLEQMTPGSIVALGSAHSHRRFAALLRRQLC